MGSLRLFLIDIKMKSLNSDKHKIRLVLNRRKGWIKIALRYGVSLVPTFTFGEAFIYDQLPNPEGSLVRRVQDYLQNIMGFAPVMSLDAVSFNTTSEYSLAENQ